MSLQALLDAAEFLEHEKSEANAKETPSNRSNVAAIRTTSIMRRTDPINTKAGSCQSEPTSTTKSMTTLSEIKLVGMHKVSSHYGPTHRDGSVAGDTTPADYNDKQQAAESTDINVRNCVQNAVEVPVVVNFKEPATKHASEQHHQLAVIDARNAVVSRKDVHRPLHNTVGDSAQVDVYRMNEQRENHVVVRRTTELVAGEVPSFPKSAGLLQETVPFQLRGPKVVSATNGQKTVLQQYDAPTIFCHSSPAAARGASHLPTTTASPDAEWRVPPITGPMINPADLIRDQRMPQGILHSADTVRLMEQAGVSTLLPSLIKTSEDEKTYAALQIKPVKHSMTLSHNQLEKNRRAHLKERFEALKSCIPRLGTRRSSNLTILKAALRHIQAIKRKSVELLQTKDALAREKQENLKRLVALKNELMNTVDINTIDKFLEESVAKDIFRKEMSSVSSLRSSSGVDDDQQSTSTASEAEEEELKAVGEPMYRLPSRSDRNIALLSRLPSGEGHPNNVDRRLLQNHVIPPTFHSTLLRSPLELTKRVVQPTTAPVVDEPRRVNPHLVQKSPLKMYTGRVGRSATPSPPSNFVSFFPRFSIGSGGSPPLLSSENENPKSSEASSGFHGSAKSMEALSTEVDERRALTIVNHLVKPVGHPNTTVASDSRLADPTRTVVFSQTPAAPVAAIRRVASPEPKSVGSPSTTALSRNAMVYSGVALHSFSGYQVKVKYVNPTDTVAPSHTPSQAHIPMKKRHFDATTFTVEKDPIKRPKMSVSYDDTVPKMTSLYVGASAGLLGLSAREGVASTSDTESDRDSPMFNDHTRTLLHWKKNAPATPERGGKEWTEYRGKAEKKKTLLLHSYEAPTTKTIIATTKSTEASRPKATFSLWDRKHHAITMTTATNWRGKQQQQLLASKTKTMVPPFSSAASAVSVHVPHSTTQVSYTTLKPSKPSIPASLLMGNSVARPQAGQNVSSSTQSSSSHSAIETTRAVHFVPASTISQSILKMVDQPALAANGVVQVVNQTTPKVQVHPSSAPSNPVAYHVMQAPYLTARPAGEPVASCAPSYVQPLTAASMGRVPTFGYIMNNTVAPDPKLISPDAAVKATQLPPANVQMPVVVPIGYVMYPGGAAGSHGIQLASLQPQQPKLIAHSDVVVPVADRSFPTITAAATKRSLTPSSSATRSRSRIGSADSGGSSTISADSTDNDAPVKKTHLSRDRNAVPVTNALPAVEAVAPAPTQFIIPGNPGFVMTNNHPTGAYSIPINMLGYPFQAYGSADAGRVQAVQMAGVPGETGQGQLWTMNHGLGLQLATSGAVTAVTSQRPLTSPVALQVLQETRGRKSSS